MLNLIEEIVLLMIDDDGGFIPVRDTAFDHSVAGAALMDLAFANRIDTDADRMTVLDSSPLGHAALDRALSLIASSAEPRTPAAWIAALASDEARAMRDMALDSLIEKGVLERSGAEVSLGLRAAAPSGRRRPAGARGQAARRRLPCCPTTSRIPGTRP